MSVVRDVVASDDIVAAARSPQEDAVRAVQDDVAGDIVAARTAQVDTSTSVVRDVVAGDDIVARIQ